jgi:tetratricopeptide (TPR) repeat protein
VWEHIQARVQPGTPRTLVIASDIAPILNLPWELMRTPGGDFVGFDPTLGIRRLPRPDTTLPAFAGALPARPLRVLFVACAPQDQEALDYEREEEALLAALTQGGTVAVDSGDLGTFEELRDRINAFQPHVVHLTGHAIVAHQCPNCRRIADAEQERCPNCTIDLRATVAQGYFAFEDERGQTDLRSGPDMVQQLFAGSGVQCAFISGCQSGKAPPVDALGGICQGLVGSSLPLAIGWAASVEDTIATQFAATFYRTLGSRQPIDRALTQARQSIRPLCEEQSDPSWTLPMLYSASMQNLVFDPDQRRAAAPPPHRGVIQQPLPGISEGYAEHFVGRRREIQRLLPDLRDGTLQTLIITGIGGAGKSTLATRLARKLEVDGFQPIAIPSTTEQPLTSAALLQRCADAFRGAARSSEARGDDYLAGLLQAGARDIENPDTPVERRLRDVVETLNQARFVLVLDNFEVNLDQATRAILDAQLAGFYTHLVQNLAGESRAIVTSRYLPAQAQSLPRMAREAPLGDFPFASFLKFLLRDPVVERRYRTGELSGTLLRELHRLLGGTPRFLDQIRVVLATISTDELRASLQQLAVSSATNADALQAARDRYCETIIAARLYDVLSAEAQAALSRAAVFGVAVNLEALAAVSGQSIERLREHTRAWQQVALAYPERGELWAIYGVVRGWLMAAERLSDADRMEAHRAAGDFLRELVGQDQEGQLGLTWIDCLLEARAQYLAAGDLEQARAVTGHISGFLDRRGLYREIERLNQELLAYEEHVDTLKWTGRAYLARGEYPAAKAQFVRAQMIAQQIGDRASEAATWHQLATIDLRMGKYDTARDKFVRALVIRQQISDRTGEASTLHNLATIDANLGDYDAARDKFARSLTIKQQIGDRAGEAATWHQMATIDLRVGEYEAAREKLAQALIVSQQLGDRAHEAACWRQLATIDLSVSEYDAAREKCTRALSMRQQIGDRAGEATCWHLLASIDLGVGEYDVAREKFTRALSMLQQIGDLLGEASTWHSLAAIDANVDEYDAAREKFARALSMLQQIGDREGEASIWHNLASIDANVDEYDAAREKLLRALSIRQQIGDRAGEASTLHNLAMIDANLGEYEAAREKFARALSIRQKLGDRVGEAATIHQLDLLAKEQGHPADRRTAAIHRQV